MKIKFELDMRTMVRQRKDAEASIVMIDVNVSQLSSEHAAVLADSLNGVSDGIPRSALILTGTDVAAVVAACEEKYLEKQRTAARDAEEQDKAAARLAAEREERAQRLALTESKIPALSELVRDIEALVANYEAQLVAELPSEDALNDLVAAYTTAQTNALSGFEGDFCVSDCHPEFWALRRRLDDSLQRLQRFRRAVQTSLTASASTLAEPGRHPRVPGLDRVELRRLVLTAVKEKAKLAYFAELTTEDRERYDAGLLPSEELQERLTHLIFAAWVADGWKRRPRVQVEHTDECTDVAQYRTYELSALSASEFATLKNAQRNADAFARPDVTFTVTPMNRSATCQTCDAWREVHYLKVTAELKGVPYGYSTLTREFAF